MQEEYGSIHEQQYATTRFVIRMPPWLRLALISVLLSLHWRSCSAYNRFWINYNTTLNQDISAYYGCLSECEAYWTTVSTVNEEKKERSMLLYLGLDPDSKGDDSGDNASGIKAEEGINTSEGIAAV